MPLLTAVSIVKGITASTYIKTTLKWPNDIMLRRKKIGGVLIESKLMKETLSVVVGIGININESVQDIPINLQNRATSLNIQTGEIYHKEINAFVS